MKKRVLIISICVAAALLVAAATVAVTGFWMPYNAAETTMDGGTMVLVCQEDGKLTMTLQGESIISIEYRMAQ